MQGFPGFFVPVIPQITMTNATAFNPLKDAEQMNSLIAGITGESVERVAERLEYERKHPGRPVAGDFAKYDGPRYEWGKHLEEF